MGDSTFFPDDGSVGNRIARVENAADQRAS
jgi:hypothetical protein